MGVANLAYSLKVNPLHSLEGFPAGKGRHGVGRILISGLQSRNMFAMRGSTHNNSKQRAPSRETHSRLGLGPLLPIAVRMVPHMPLAIKIGYGFARIYTDKECQPSLSLPFSHNAAMSSWTLAQVAEHNKPSYVARIRPLLFLPN